MSLSMKQIALKIASVSMALLVLCSTLSYTVEQHYCGNFLADSSWFGHAKSCGMEVLQTNSKTAGCELVQTGCCSNKIFHIEGQDELNSAAHQWAFEPLHFDAVPSTAYQLLPLLDGDEQVTFEHYVPPIIVRNVQVLHQTFLI